MANRLLFLILVSYMVVVPVYGQQASGTTQPSASVDSGDSVDSVEKMSLDLDAAIQLALQNDTEYRQLAVGYTNAREQRAAAYGELLIPDVSGSVGGQWNQGSYSSTNSGSATSTDDWVNNSRMSLDIAYNFQGFANVFKVKEVDAEYLLAKYSYEERAGTVIYNTKRDFYNLFYLQENTKLQQDIADQLEAAYATTRRTYAAGRTSRLDRLQSQVEYLNQLPNLNSAIREEKTARQNFFSALGMSDYAETNVVLLGTLWTLTNYQEIPPPVESNAIVDVLNRDLRIMSNHISILTLGAQKGQANAPRMPGVGVYFSYYGRAPQGTESGVQDGIDTGVTLKVPITDWLPANAVYGDVQEIQAQQDQVRIDGEDTVNEVRLEVQSLYLELEELRNTLLASRLSAQQADESRISAFQQYRAGELSLVDYTDYLVNYQTARSTYMLSVYSNAEARFRLERLIGDYTLSEWSNFDDVHNEAHEEENWETPPPEQVQENVPSNQEE